MHPEVQKILDAHKENKDQQLKRALQREMERIEEIKPLLPEWTHEYLVGSVSYLNYDSPHQFIALRIPRCMEIRVEVVLTPLTIEKPSREKYLRFDVMDDFRQPHAHATVKFTLEDAIVLAEQRFRQRTLPTAKPRKGVL